MRFVPGSILQTNNQTNNECLPKFVQTDDVSSSIKNGHFQGRGISSSGRAPASHAGGTGIDTRILQLFFGVVYIALFLTTILNN